MNKFGENLKALRTYRHLTLEQLGNALGLDKSTIHGYETGKRNPGHEIEEAIADYFNVSLDSLRGHEPIDFSVQNDTPEIQMIVSFLRDMNHEDVMKVMAFTEFVWNGKR